jgi:hypothetical protein
MHSQDKQKEPLWGARINRSGLRRTHDCPDWANRLQREKWKERSLVLWDHESHQITGLSVTQALQVLNHLRINDDWKQQGVVVGEPVTRLSIDDPTREPEEVLINQIDLSPAQVQELFNLLRENETMLKEQSEQEERERKQALLQAYNFLLGYAARAGMS